MAINWSLYERKLKIDGDTFKDRQINYMKDAIINNFQSNPSYQLIKINDIDRDVQIVDENALTKNPNKKCVLCKPDEDINTGNDILWNNHHWLCTNVDGDKEIYAKGIIEKCNNTLKWQTPTGEIKEYPCIIQDKTSVYSSGIEENKYLSLADDQILIIVQSNDDTKQLKINKRFIFNHSEYEVYELTKIQTLIQNGLLYLTMTKSQYNETSDNLDDNIADYMPTNFTLTILNGDTISLNTSQTLQLSCELRNNGVLVENPTITYQSSDPLIASINSSGVITALQTGIVTITATSSGVSDSLIVTVEEVPVNNYSIEFVNPSTSIYQGQSKTYTCVVYNNGIEVIGKPVTWNISNTSLVTITSSTDTTCTIKGSSSNLGYVILRCTLVEDANVYSEVTIQVKSIM